MSTPLSSDDVRSRVLRRWGLTVPEECDEPGGGLTRLETADGPVVLKELLDLDRRQILFQHRVALALAAAGLPVPEPIPAANGRTLVTTNGRRYALYRWIDGRHRNGLDLSLPACQELGGLLGRVHRELDRMTPPVQQALLIPTPRARDAIATADRLLAGLPHPRDDFDSLAERHLRERRELLHDLADHQPPEMEAVAVGYVHGDFHAGNLLFGRLGIVAILGWDRLKVAPFAAELVRAATSLFGHGDEHGMDLERVTAFVRGHAAVFELDAAQIQSAAHRLWWERLCDVSVFERRHLDQGPSAAAFVQWWTTELESTLDAFAAPYTSTRRDAQDDEILEVS
ncbi:MAG: aminoglycoside phosphotransferase [Actinomycetia bacterium]|nr:aminoglycoside phosphotransferase [Actinomycetes bacterium]